LQNSPGERIKFVDTVDISGRDPETSVAAATKICDVEIAVRADIVKSRASLMLLPM
jgi:hypothetical protein